MKTKRSSVEQIVSVLKESDMGTPVADLIRKVGVSEQTFYRWKKVYGGLEPRLARKLKQMGEEYAKLKRLVADLSLHRIMLQEMLKRSGEALAAARHDPVLVHALRGELATGLQGGVVHALELPHRSRPNPRIELRVRIR